MKEKHIIIMGIIITLLVTMSFIFFIIAKKTYEPIDILFFALPVIIVITSAYIIHDKMKNLKAGLPTKDERLKNVAYKAGYYAFIAAIWSALGSNFLSNLIYDHDLRGGLVVAAVVLTSGFVFMISYLYFSRKGN